MSARRPSVRPRGRRLLAVLLGLGLVLAPAGCARDLSQTPNGLPPADDALRAIAAALSAMDLAGSPFAAATPAPAADVAAVVEEMDGYRPEVAAGAVTYEEEDGSAVGVLAYTWSFPSGDWTYEATVGLRYEDDAWRGLWAPAVMHPRLDADHRLVHTREAARRAGITGQGGQTLVDEVTVVHVGVDK
ncbi:MAG: hypothetical protein LBH76_04245, partial [Propionibacteriaceae bacterium]|nr:hypothetical protein [Propionibacteriaceae bacterium]